MSRFRSIPYAVLTSGLLVSGGAFAQSMGTIDQRQDYQQDRIEHGIQDGQITRSEAGRLEQGEQAINRAQARATADGNVTPQERQHIDNMVTRENRAISQDSHNSQQSWDRGQNWGHNDGRQDGRQYGDRGQDHSHDGWGRDNNNRTGWNDNRGQDPRNGGWNHQPGTTPGSTQANGAQPSQGWGHQQQPGGTQPGGTQTGSTQQPSRGNWGNGWNHQQPGTTQTAGTTPTQGTGTQQPSRGGWTHQPTTTTTPAAGTQPTAQPSHSWGNGGGNYVQQAAAAPTTAAARPSFGGHTRSR
jgi:hypothetical protein